MLFRFGFSRKRAEQITSAPANVSGVSPADGSTNLQLDITISWNRPSMAKWYDVYFGETAETLALVSDGQLARTYAPTLALDKTYYLRIDAGNSLGTTTGDVVSFSTWASTDIETDELGAPLTDETGKYIETFI